MLVAGTCAIAVFMPSSASAGRLVATGNDADDHCQGSSHLQCHFLGVALNYVRAGAPNPSAPVLAIDCNGDVDRALDELAPAPARVVKCPSRAADGFASKPLTTELYSAIVVGSSCGGADAHDSINRTDDCDQANPGPNATPDSDALLARKGDIGAFSDAGGGILALAGEVNGDGDPTTGPESYYSFLPVGVTGAYVTEPFTLTDDGVGLGFEDKLNDNPSGATHNDVNCQVDFPFNCGKHNAFGEPAPGSLLKVAERDGSGAPVTLFADVPAPPAPVLQTVQQKSGPTAVAGESMIVDPLTGTVYVKLPGTDKFVNINEVTQIPVGTIVDTTKGYANLTSAADLAGKTQTATFWDGAFVVKQKKEQNPVTDLVLTGGPLKQCTSSKPRRVAFVGSAERNAGLSRATRKRRLWGSGKGHFRTRGRNSAAEVRGTKWLTSDDCAGTRTKVRRGKVKVRDFKRNRTVTVTAGQTYLASP
jgi:hypothetical protein